MTFLRALTTGSRMATDAFAGTVQSVFNRACNITLDDGRLVTLLSTEHGNIPHGARVHTPDDFTFDTIVRAGERATCNRGVLRLHTARLAVQLKGARRWQARLDDLAADVTDAQVATAVQAARRSVHEFVRSHPRSDDAALEQRCRAFRDAVSRRRKGEIEVALNRLIGYGSGLTPAGDDYTIGFLAGLRSAAGHHADRRALLECIGVLVRIAASRTNSISRSYLFHASNGAFAEPLTTLATCIALSGAQPGLATATRTALAVGASSGVAGVRGLLHAMTCRIWRRHRCDGRIS